MVLAFVVIFGVTGAYAAMSTFSVPMLPQPADSGNGGDQYGYTFVDNDNGGSPTYSWVDITGVGTLVEGLADDNTVGPFQIGFDFPFYWYTVDHFYIGSNGHISFSSGANYSQAFPMIPAIAAPNNLVVPLAADLDFTAPYGTNECYMYSNNTDSLVVSWIGVAEWDSPYEPGHTHTFQLILCAADSSITFQYGEQGGDFMNTEGNVQIGIEDLVGRSGLRYYYNLAPTQYAPHDGLAIRLHADPDPSFQFRDVGVEGSMNESSGGIFQRVGQAMQLGAFVKNYGTVDVDSIRVALRIKKGFVTVMSDTVRISQLGAGEVAWVDGYDTYTPDEVADYALEFKTIISNDAFSPNNADTCEMRSYNMPAMLGYCDTVYSYTSWQGGGGGFANEFVAPENLVVTGMRAGLLWDGAAPSYWYIMPADENGNPDVNNILFGDTLQLADTNWVSINNIPDIVFYEGQKFFAAILSGGEGVTFGIDNTTPLSFRGWENTGTYAGSRDRSVQDIGIMVMVDGYTGIDEQDNRPINFSLNQNYPNPFNATTKISFNTAATGNVVLDVYNITGQKVKTLINSEMTAGVHSIIWDGTNEEGNVISSGVYFYHLQVADRSETKKMILLK